MALRVEFGAHNHQNGGSAHQFGPEALDRLFERQYGVVALWQALQLDISRRQIDRLAARGVWRRRYEEVYELVGAGKRPHTEWMAAVAAGGRGAVLAGLPALALRGLPGGHPYPLAIAVPRPRQPRIPGITIHRLDGLPILDGDADEDFGIPVLPPAWMLLLACHALGSAARAQPTVDAALRNGLITIDGLDAFIVERCGRGRNGSRVLRQCLVDAVPHSESAAETLLIRVIRRHGLPEPVGPIFLWDGPVLRRVDFGYPALRLCIEVDGRRYHELASDLRRDARKEHLMELAGTDWIRTTWRELTEQPHAFACRLAARLGLPEPPAR
jgi:very-short-patch-repair endonuclease